MGGRALGRLRYNPQASIAIVGLQGAGKRSLAFIASSHLRRRLILECVHFEQATGLTKSTYVRKHGRERFYSKAIELLKSMLHQYGQGSVIVCGVTGLVPGTTEIIADFARTHAVIHVQRDLQNIRDETRSLEADQLHKMCSNFEYFNLEESDAEITPDNLEQTVFCLRQVRSDFERFLDFIVPHPERESLGHFYLDAIPVERRGHSTVLSVQMSDALSRGDMKFLKDVVEDAVELRLARWDNVTHQNLGRCLAIIRRATRAPIIISLHTPESKNIELDQSSYVQACVKLGVEYMVVSPKLAQQQRSFLLNGKGCTKAIAHYHFEDDGLGLGRWSSKQRLEACIEAQWQSFDIVRLTQDSLRRQDNLDVNCFLQKISASEQISIPVSAYNIGPFTKPSKISNTILTPVLSSYTEAADGDRGLSAGVSVRDIVHAHFATYEYDALSFYVLGTHVLESLTPTMNQAAYDFYGMRHSFTRHFALTFEQVMTLAQNFHFGGAAITTPFKEQAYQACIASSPHADAIGAVNTILPLRRLGGSKTQSLVEQALLRNRAGLVVGLYGDNSDWYGIYTNVRQRLSPKNAANLSRSNALVIGAGGSARSAVYALMRFRMHTIYICNRTYSSAVRLAEHFRAWGIKSGHESRLQVLRDLQLTDDIHPLTVIVSCVPSGTIDMPERLLQNSSGVVADMCYAPPNTALHHEVRQSNSRGKQQWSLVEGRDILLESCILQFEQMTGYRAPRSVMERAIRSANVEM